MAACRRIYSIAQKHPVYLLKHQKRYSSKSQLNTVTASDEVVIPYRIERGPTDILKALASTIRKDYTAAHFKYEDDPYLIPFSSVQKRAFALSKESGKKAARYFLETYPDLFKCNESAPHITAFHPPVQYTEENVLNVEPLRHCIRQSEVDNAINIYEILSKKGITVNQDLKQDLLQLLCFYNSAQPPPEDYYEERYFARRDVKGERWNSKGMAETVFSVMEKDNLAYSSMIAGTAKHNDADRACTLYEEMRQNGFPGTVEAYNELICIIPMVKEDSETRWEFAIRLLSAMKADGLHPDLYTMNSLLEILSRTTRWRKSMQMSLRVLAEMKRLKIEPSLGTYHYLLTIFCSQDVTHASILYQILSEVENREHSVRHPSDVRFFDTAMELCWKGIGDIDLGYRIHNLLETGNNCKLLGNAFSESIYFKNFLRFLCEKEDMDKFMEVYEKYVPNTYVPEASVTLSIVQAIHFTGSYKYLPKMCSDVLLFEQTERENILSVLLEAAGCMQHDATVQKNLIDMVWNILEKINIRSQSTRRLPFEWTGVLLGDMLKTFLNGKDLEKSWSVVKKLKEEMHQIIGFPDISILLKFCELGLQSEEYDKVAYCIKYAINGAYPDFHTDVQQLTKDMFEKQLLAEKQRDEVNRLVQNASSLDDSSSSDGDSDGSSSSDSSDDENDKK